MLFDLIEASKKLISIDSTSSRGTAEAVRYLTPFCEKLGLKVTLQTPSGKEGEIDVNLIAHTSLQGSMDLCPGGLVFMTHLDTVPGGDGSQWTKTAGQPLSATIEGDDLYGLGSADTKLDILCKLLALERVGVSNLKTPFALVGTFGEETALAGARLLQSTKKMTPKWALVSEPSELKPVIGHKGILYLRAIWENTPHPSPLPQAGEGAKMMKFPGKAAHGSMPHLGDNAIEKAWAWVFSQGNDVELRRIHGGTVHNVVPDRCEVSFAKAERSCPRVNFLKVFADCLEKSRKLIEKTSNAAFDPPTATVNVGVIRGDLNKIEMEFDFRLIPESNVTALQACFDEVAQKSPGGRVEVIRGNPPLATNPESPWVKQVQKALEGVGRPTKTWVKSGNTEGAILSAMGTEAIVIGPGESVGNIHAPNEHNKISQMNQAVDFYEAILRQFC